MSYATLILGESGSGKTCSLRNIDPNAALLIQPIKKPLPFRSSGWYFVKTAIDRVEKDGRTYESTRRLTGGNILVSDDIPFLIGSMQETSKPIIIIDDWQYFLSFKMMALRAVGGYDKWTTIGGCGFDLAKAASELSDEKRVYILAHSVTENGVTRVKTVGKVLDEKIVIEGMFTTVLRTVVDQGRYLFRTHNTGFDTVKSPLGLFEKDEIDNDLAAVDAAICDFYHINSTTENDQEEPK